MNQVLPGALAANASASRWWQGTTAWSAVAGPRKTLPWLNRPTRAQRVTSHCHRRATSAQYACARHPNKGVHSTHRRPSPRAQNGLVKRVSAGATLTEQRAEQLPRAARRTRSQLVPPSQHTRDEGWHTERRCSGSSAHSWKRGRPAQNTPERDTHATQAPTSSAVLQQPPGHVPPRCTPPRANPSQQRAWRATPQSRHPLSFVGNAVVLWLIQSCVWGKSQGPSKGAIRTTHGAW
jgi:hypothetical protein